MASLASKYHRNAVITGCVNSLCLACQRFLNSDVEVNKHIGTVEHIENLHRYPYLEKYKDDGIRKVKKLYYCEMCNIVLSTTSKVKTHVIEKTHNKNKSTQLLYPLGNGAMSYQEIIINENSWHSLMDSTCAICNIQFDDVNIHRNDTTHLLKLVLSNVEFGENNSVYRTIDSSSFHCMTCNVMCPLNTITKHFTEPEHEKRYDSCRYIQKQIEKHDKSTTATSSKSLKKNQRTKGVNVHTDVTDVSADFSGTSEKHAVDPIKTKPTDAVDLQIQHAESSGENTNTATNKEQNKARILNSIIKYQKNEIDVNFEIETVFCKKCFKHLKFHADDIECHIEEHTKNPSDIEQSVTYPSIVDKNHGETILVEKTNEASTSSAGNENTAVSVAGQNYSEIADDSQKIGIMIDNKPKDFDSNVEKGNKETSKNPKQDTQVPTTSANTSEFDETCSFAKQNKITYNPNKNNAFCRICETKLPLSLKGMKEHVLGKEHKGKVKKSEYVPKLNKKTMAHFVKNVVKVKNELHHDEIINEQFCITNLSFMLIAKNDSRMRCRLCEINLTVEQVHFHVDSGRHTAEMLRTPVVTNLHLEFVREVRPGLFHCGYCDLVLPNWSDFESHTKCSEHEKHKKDCIGRLMKCLPGIVKKRKREELMMRRHMLGGR